VGWFIIDYLCVLFMVDGVKRNIGINASFDKIYDWKEIREKAGKFNTTKADNTDDGALSQILNAYYTNTCVCIYIYRYVYRIRF
jgi:hypothetical protein